MRQLDQLTGIIYIFKREIVHYPIIKIFEGWDKADDFMHSKPLNGNWTTVNVVCLREIENKVMVRLLFIQFPGIIDGCFL